MMHGPVMQGPPRPGVAVTEPRRRFNLRTFDSLKVRDYRFYMASSLFQMACMNMQMMASGWFMYKLSGSAALLGLTMLANAVPQVALSFVGGVVADRVPKKVVILLGLLASSALVLGIAASTTLEMITWHYLVAASFIQGVIMALMMPSRQALVPQLVGRENLMNAISLNMAGMNVNRLGAPAVAGFIVGAMGIEAVYYLMSGLYLVAFVLLLPISPRPGIGGRGRTVLADVLQGLAYVRDNANVRAVLVLTLLAVLLSMPYMFLLPIFTEDVLKVGPEGLGLLISISGVGALGGSFLIATISGKRRGMLLLHSIILTAVALVAFAASHSYTLSLAIIVVVGLAQAVRMTLTNTLLQSYSEDAYMGRVMSLMMMEFGLTGFGSFGVSLVAQAVGVQWAVGATAALLVVVTVWYYSFSPRLRQMD